MLPQLLPFAFQRSDKGCQGAQQNDRKKDHLQYSLGNEQFNTPLAFSLVHFVFQSPVEMQMLFFRMILIQTSMQALPWRETISDSSVKGA